MIPVKLSYSYYLQLMDEKTEAQRGWVTYPRALRRELTVMALCWLYYSSSPSFSLGLWNV